jgi:hypothetical protein
MRKVLYLEGASEHQHLNVKHPPLYVHVGADELTGAS